ncbi:MAG: hypothetical protein A3J65_04320 [Candidatus Buchananbacteria bacterium RIFCSPHIGHO2_02_FULL_45_11b]|uniref:Uncharacterized protein n=3 Tax=Candidatus Buchananiibacteriota TaxID=1817903 RepID=A0A1G1YCT4_9BACT|nr:MAG: hypothetical protein A3J65_04320 [Candidatus Buchananbacteria bacterium RIFCSPHIGHO2_02_FULL_45_11b]OGY53680.1 MAG: hypothetical protein A3B15_01995 [Candidatus Buchananbacteria bacterium RIFCSPLOWO2_01_FULL_45_31]OGY56233.1 MAG: hypothetical protein A3H67_03960 [Candidatus Buchananbacteria bacterium RIFCSPLOWO2_02_FULL_46_11b]
MRSKECYYLYRIYALLKLKEFDVFFQKLRNGRGETDTVAAIYLDPENQVLPTFIHECLHVLYPEWKESRILMAEKRIFNSLNEKQIKNLLARLNDAVNHQED